MEDVLTELYEVVTQRHENPQEGSYTCYLFDQGLDKILKKVGEESAETIIAAKNGIKEDTVGEISDLLFHLVVMMKNEGITPDDVKAELSSVIKNPGTSKNFIRWIKIPESRCLASTNGILPFCGRFFVIYLFLLSYNDKIFY